MELEGFKKRPWTGREGENGLEYHPDDASPWRCLRLRTKGETHVVVELVERGVVPGVLPGERVTSPVFSPMLARRLLRVAAVHNFDACWLEDGFTEIDLPMVSRGFEVGRLPSGELVWFRKEGAATMVVKREDSDELPSDFSQPTRLAVVGPSGRELAVKALDYRSLVAFMDSNAHYEMYQPYQNLTLNGVYSKEGVTRH